MKRITTLLRESQAMTVRKAVCMAGAESVVITPVTPHSDLIDSWLWHGEHGHVQLEVRTDDSHYGGIVSAIKRTVHVGNIAFPACNDSQLSCAA